MPDFYEALSWRVEVAPASPLYVELLYPDPADAMYEDCLKYIVSYIVVGRAERNTACTS